MAKLEAKAVEVLCRAAAVGDKTIDVYLDTERLNVVKVKDGQCVPEDLALKIQTFRSLDAAAPAETILASSFESFRDD